MTPQQQLISRTHEIIEMIGRQAECFTNQVKPLLARNGIHSSRGPTSPRPNATSPITIFASNVFPILTPLSVDRASVPIHLEISRCPLGVTLQYPRTNRKILRPYKGPRGASLTGPPETKDSNGHFRFISLQDLINHNSGDLFPNMILLDAMPFRIIRNADIERE
jgi:polyphosphate kinase